MRIFYSADGGATWAEAALTCVGQDCRGYNPAFLTLGNQSRVPSVVTDRDVFISSDDGATWAECWWNGDWIADSLSSVALDPIREGRLLLATTGEGISITTDGCQSWLTSNAGLSSLFVHTIAIDPANSSIVYAGTDGGAYISSDSGRSWGPINDGLLGATVVYSIVIDSQSDVYAATPYGIFKLESK
jgi:photosystem II stability/assembly factor-like uncharacterized protein